MIVNRRVRFVVVGVALAGWLAVAATPGGHDATVLAPVKPSPNDKRGDVLASEISRLHDRLRPSAIPRQPGRNLFSFAARPVRPAPLPPPVPAPALSEAPAIPRPVAPVLKLSGVAEDTTADGVVRTAIISAFGQLFLVKEGEIVTPRFRVVRISSDVVELSDTTDGSTMRLALR
jgi:hypothetical protein